jgi:hypothetical protein
VGLLMGEIFCGWGGEGCPDGGAVAGAVSELGRWVTSPAGPRRAGADGAGVWLELAAGAGVETGGVAGAPAAGSGEAGCLGGWLAAGTDAAGCLVAWLAAGGDAAGCLVVWPVADG